MLKTKFETLRDLIKKDIVSGKYLPGMNLPTEKELRKVYGVNHSTINKAISSLSADGFIKTKPRNGSIVLPMRERKIPARLGIYVMRSTGHIFDKLNSEILNTLQKNYYFPLLVNLDYITGDRNLDWLQSHMEEAIQSMPELMIVDGQAGFPFDFLRHRQGEIQNLIFVNRFEHNHDIASIKILSDYEQGGYLAGRHLLESGCKKMMVVLRTREVLYDDINISHFQIQGLKRAMVEGGRDPESLVFIARDDLDFTERLKSLFSGPHPYDGIFSHDDFIAYHTIHAAQRMNIQHGRDYRLVGYFDTPWANDSSILFDTVSINQEGIAAKLHEIINERHYEKNTWMIKPVLKKTISSPEIKFP